MTDAANTAVAAANTNEGTQKKPRAFAPIFHATLTPSNIISGVAANGRGYVTMRETFVQQAGKKDKTVTVTAFGKQLAEVRDLLVEGQPVELAVQFDGWNSLKIVGLPRDKSAPVEDVAQVA